MKLLIKIISLSLILCENLAQAASPAGLWQTFDDTTHKPRSLVRISEQNGVYSATIEKGLNHDDDPNRVCDLCTDERKGQKLLGMVIMHNLKESKPNLYEGGDILDPENGKVYKCKLMLSEDGKTLEVRGFIGISLLGRSQTWLREE